MVFVSTCSPSEMVLKFVIGGTPWFKSIIWFGEEGKYVSGENRKFLPV